MAEGEPRSEQEVIARFQDMRQAVQSYGHKINELEAEVGEHDLVIKTLEPMDGGRKCFRLVGGVLVERTVAEVLPAVKTHREQLELLVSRLREQAEAKKAELLAFQQKYKIRIKGQGDEGEGGAATKNRSAQGVLV